MLDERCYCSDLMVTGVEILASLVLSTGVSSAWCTHASGAWHARTRTSSKAAQALGCHPRDCWSECHKNGYAFATIEAGTSSLPDLSSSLSDDDFIDEARCLCVLGNQQAFAAY